LLLHPLVPVQWLPVHGGQGEGGAATELERQKKTRGSDHIS